MEAKALENMSQVERKEFKRKIEALNRYALLEVKEATTLSVGFTPDDKNTMHIGMVTGDDLFVKGVSIKIVIRKGSHAADIVRALVSSADLIRNANKQIVKERGNGHGLGAFLNRVLDLAAALFAAPGIAFDWIVKNIKKRG